MIEPGLTAVEVLGLAIAQEVAAHKRYKLFSQRVKNPLVKEKFISLANEEKAHREMLYKMLQQYSGEEKPPLPQKAPRLDEDAELEKPLHEIIELAIKKEQEAQQFYKEAAEITNEPTGKHLLLYLAKFEEGHERTLQEELSAVAKYPRWFDMEGPDIMLVGP